MTVSKVDINFGRISLAVLKRSGILLNLLKRHFGDDSLQSK